MDKVKVFQPELDFIKTKAIKEFAEIAVAGLPDYFFEIPASSSGKYHPSYALGSGGVVRHTKAAVRIANDLLVLDMFQKKFTQEDKDLTILSLILHDGIKQGTKGGNHSVAEHPLHAARYVKNLNSDIKLLDDEQEDKVVKSIAAHMGQWNTDYKKNEIMPKPHGAMQTFVHMCDYLASRKYLDFNFGDEYYDPENY